jgi:hypothetical protein
MSLLQIGFVLGNQDNIPTDLSSFTVGLTKILFLIGSLLYLIFAVIVVRQIHLMKNTVQTDFSPLVQILGYIHLAFALVVVLVFLGL